MKKTLAAVCSSLTLAACSLVGIRTSPEPPHEVLRSEGKIELRQYQPQLIAETFVQKDYDQAGSAGFRRLAGYIFGGNRAKEQISMTAPVLQEAQSRSITMTAPVLQEETANGWWMAFILPVEITLANAPEPTNPAVKLREIPAKRQVSLQYSGRNSPSEMQRHAKELSAWIDQQGLRPLTDPKMASYDPPWTLWFLRRNEVQVEVE
jgi:hypothetical protein